MPIREDKSSIINLDIVKIKNGDIEFFEQLFKQYYEPLIYFAYRYVQDKQAAEDIIQDIFVYLWDKREKLDFGINIKTYLYSAVKNRCLKYLKRKAVEIKYRPLEIILAKDADNPESIMINDELQEALTSAINELPEKRREIFCMNRFDELTYAEIASILNLSIKTVETQMSRALKFLRISLSNFLASLIL